VRRAGIIGTGLIGASIGLGLTRAGWDVTGWDPDAGVRADAVAVGALARTAAHLDDLLAAPSDVVVLAGPPRAVIEQVGSLATDGLVIDVAGVKAPVVAASRLPHFVGTHPMAGRETTGPAAASAGLFRGAVWVIVTDGADPADLDAVEAIVEELGGLPRRMTAAEHDAAVAVISHLPQVLAAALATEAADRTRVVELAAGSFRDLTRVAASDPATWVQLLDANRGPVVETVRDFRDRLDRFTAAVEEGDVASVAEVLAAARQLRRDLAPAVVAVRVALADQPGELAKVGRGLESSAVDVRDLQLRHAPYGGGGVLTISVRPGEAETLRVALEEQGLLIVE
jgi:prephenate dehydrogenase